MILILESNFIAFFKCFFANDDITGFGLYNILKLPNAAHIETFAGGSFELVELWLKPDSPLDGMALTELRRRYAAKFLVCAVQRGDELVIPSGNFVLQAGDRIALTAAPHEIQKLLRQLGIMQKKARNVMVLGGSRTAQYLSRLLLTGGNSVKLVEQDRDRCTELCDDLPGAVIIHGDGAKQEVLLEEGLSSMDAFVALTGSDEENILISIYAASQKVPKVIAKVNRGELAAMADKLGLDCTVSPKKTVAGILTRYARALQNTEGSSVESLYRIMDGRAEMLEFRVAPEFPYVNIPIVELQKNHGLLPGVLIAGIIRGRRTIIPTGADSIQPRDRVIVLSADRRLGELSDIIQH